MNLTQTQKARIQCIKIGHANVVSIFMAYVTCGRCGEQIGDTYSSPINLLSKALIGHKCERCTDAYNKLSNDDQLIFRRLEKGLNQEEALKGIDFE